MTVPLHITAYAPYRMIFPPINYNTATIKIMLSDTLPADTAQFDTDIVEIAAGHGYPAGGLTLTGQTLFELTGNAQLTANAVTLTASGGSVGPFRYAVLYQFVGVGDYNPVFGYWDFGSEITLADGATLTIGSDDTGAAWIPGAPLLEWTR